MTDSLLHAYLPLFGWAGLGILLFRLLPEDVPRILGRSLYWVGVPLEILALARRTSFSTETRLVPLITIAALLSGLVLAWASLKWIRAWATISSATAATDMELASSDASLNVSPAAPFSQPTANRMTSNAKEPLLGSPALSWDDRPRQGAFLISSIIGNTGFVGLSVVPAFISDPFVGWIVLYGVTQNLFGTYGLSVFIASSFGRSTPGNQWWLQLRDVLTVPSLWAFTIGAATQAVPLPPVLESGLQASIWCVIPVALVLMGMRISQLKGWKSLKLAIVPAVLKMVILPGWIAFLVTLLGVSGDGRLALVLMSGMPTAFAGLILAEEYELDRELMASSVILTSAMLVLTIPIALFFLAPK